MLNYARADQSGAMTDRVLGHTGGLWERCSSRRARYAYRPV